MCIENALKLCEPPYDDDDRCFTVLKKERIDLENNEIFLLKIHKKNKLFEKKKKGKKRKHTCNCNCTFKINKKSIAVNLL